MPFGTITQPCLASEPHDLGQQKVTAGRRLGGAGPVAHDTADPDLDQIAEPRWAGPAPVSSIELAPRCGGPEEQVN